MYVNKDIERVGGLKKPTYIQDMNTQDVDRIERYIRERYETGKAFDNLINNIKEKRKKRYMNIKVKAALTVVVFFVGMIGTMIGIISIPEAWVETIFKGAIVLAALAFSYKVAYDYYVAKEELKEIEEARSNKPDPLDSLKDINVWTYDDGASIRPPRGRRMPKKEEPSK